MESKTLIRVGGISGLAVAAMQLGGNILHPPMPPDPVQSIHVIQQTAAWVPVHLVITVSYFLFIPFAIGAAASFANRPATVRFATPLVLVGAALGAAQIMTHLTIFHRIAALFGQASTALQSSLIQLYDVLWRYSVALEVAHLEVIYIAALLFGFAMIREPAYPRWIGWMGLAAGVIATAGIFVGKFVVLGRTGDLIFGATLLPLIVWMVATAITLLRIQPQESQSPLVAAGR
jgi:hypothetical protein